MERPPSVGNFEKDPKIRKILEIGAGNNPLTESLKKFGVDTGEVVITDISPDSFLRGVDKHYDPFVPRHGQRDSEFMYVAAAAYNLPFKDTAFTDIIANNLFGDPSFNVGKDSGLYKKAYYVKPSDPSIDLFFKELSRVLVSGGKVTILDTYTPETAERFLSKHKGVWEKYFVFENGSEIIPKEFTEKLFGFHKRDSLLVTLRKK